MPHSKTRSFDVVIGGGGLAGLTLARQLRQRKPHLQVAVVDQLQRPLPEAAFKVGESTVEIGAHYLGDMLGLGDYITNKHFTKFGLRYFMGDGHLPLEKRGEWGTDEPMPVPSYQLDRGRFEEDLRGMILDDGVFLFEGFKLVDVDLAEDHGQHQVSLQDEAGDKYTLHCRWFVDAMGRRKFLQRKLNLEKRSPHQASAVWFRMEGRLDVDDLVPSSSPWHQQVPKGQRYFSTNHLMGEGYWVWLIPLSSGHTSIGIVTDENLHPYRSMASFGKARQWLATHEPVLNNYLEDHKPLDFHGLRNFSYLTKKPFSHQRWACVGEAALFLDPFYSPGTDMIALSNLITGALIGLDDEGKLNEDVVRHYNRFYLGFAKTFLQTYTQRYPVFASPKVTAHKILWDTCVYWVWAGQLFFRGLLEKPHLFPKLMALGIQFSLLHRQVQDFFCQWAAKDSQEPDTLFLAPLKIPIFKDLHLDLIREKPPEQAIEDMWSNLARFEEWAQVLFFDALHQIAPQQAAKFREAPWVDAWSIDLDSKTWAASGLTQPQSAPRDLTPIRQDLSCGPQEMALST